MPEGILRGVTINRDLCIGSGLCTVYAAATFSQDEDAKVCVVDPEGDAADAIRTAVEACPTGALALADAD
jgi:ferredoxin